MHHETPDFNDTTAVAHRNKILGFGAKRVLTWYDVTLDPQLIEFK